MHECPKHTMLCHSEEWSDEESRFRRENETLRSAQGDKLDLPRLATRNLRGVLHPQVDPSGFDSECT